MNLNNNKREKSNKLLPSDFYYDKFGNMVFTEEYHIRRGVCCGSGCRHCPFDPTHIKGNRNIHASIKK
jgi:hypothetical protein